MREKPIVRRIETLAGGHCYVDAQDHPVAGVTTILNALPKVGLTTWKLKMAVELALKGETAWKGMPEGIAPIKWLVDAGEREANKAAKIGTGAHNFAEQYLLGNNPKLEELGKKEKFHSECFLHFVRDFEPKPILLEKVVTYIDPKLGIPLYCGTLDLVAELNDGVTWLIDWKSSSGQARPSHALQAAAYRHATHWIDIETGELHPMVKCDRAAVILLNGGSNDRCYRAYELDTSEVVFSVFKSLLRIYNFDRIADRVIIGEL